MNSSKDEYNVGTFKENAKNMMKKKSVLAKRSNEFQGLFGIPIKLGMLGIIHYGHLLHKSAQFHDNCPFITLKTVTLSSDYSR